MKILGISGWKGSGKDTAADKLISKYGFTRFAFADQLKTLVHKEYGIPLESMHKQELKEKPIMSMPVNATDEFTKGLLPLIESELKEVDGVKYWTPRALCILKGSVNRLVDKDFWVNYTISSIKALDKDLVVITDLRYKSELDSLQAAFGDNFKSLRINRFSESTSADASERDLDDANFNFEIDNTGPLSELYACLDLIIQVWK